MINAKTRERHFERRLHTRFDSGYWNVFLLLGKMINTALEAGFSAGMYARAMLQGFKHPPLALYLLCFCFDCFFLYFNTCLSERSVMYEDNPTPFIDTTFFLRKEKKLLWLFSHESKVRNWNDHSNCAIWITQCTHERSNCDIWITQCTHERPNLEFCIPEREKNVWVPCQSNMHGARISCTSVHMQRAIYRRKWLEGHVAPPPKSQFRCQGIHTAISLRDLRDA